jgi:transcriptional regulator with XRE-family HTH domain
MPESYGWDTIEAAEELYILDGLTFDQVAERTGVSVSQLKRWSADASPSWPDRRKEYRAAQVSVRRGVMLAKAKLIASVIESEDPQKAYAFGALVSSGKQIEAEARERSAAATIAVAAPDVAADHLPEGANMVEALRVAVQARVAALTQQPGAITLGAVKELLTAMEILERKAGNGGENDAKPTMTPEQLQAMIREVYGH